MNIHKNAGTTANRQVLIVARLRAGETPRSIAGAVSIAGCRRCFAGDRQEMAPAPRKRRRGGSRGPDQPAASPAHAGHIRADHAGRSPAPEPSTVLENRPFWKIARETGLSRATVARIGKAKGLSRLSNLDPKIEIVRDEKTLPGEMIHSDIKKRGRIEGVGHRIAGNRTGQSAPRSRKQGGKGGEYLHLAVDDHSRLAYSDS